MSRLNYFIPLAAGLLLVSPVSVVLGQSGEEQRLPSISSAQVFYTEDRTLEVQLDLSDVDPGDGLSLRLLVDPNRSSDGQYCLGTGFTYNAALADFAAHCQFQLRDCDLYNGIWYCADADLFEKPSLRFISQLDVRNTAVTDTGIESLVAADNNQVVVVAVEDSEAASNSITSSNDASQQTCLATASSLASAQVSYSQQCSAPRLDCDPVAGQWVCGNVDIQSVEPSVLTALVGERAPQSPVVTLALPSNNQSTATGRIGSNDLLVLHFDNAPDLDDGHALVAGRVLKDYYGINSVLAVNGTHGHALRSKFQTASERLFQQAWPVGLNAYRDWQGSVATSASLWSDTISQGNRVWVAEGGPSDFTADVLRNLPASQRKSVTIVQHSHGWNENNSKSSNISFISSQSNYVRIDNGNTGGNGTADLNQKSQYFLNVARSSQWGELWQAAFEYLDPDVKLDFSDTVEFLWLLNVPLNEVANPNDFANKYLR